MRSLPIHRCLALLALTVGALAADGIPEGLHVVELHDADVAMPKVMEVFAKLKLTQEQALPLIQKVSTAGKAVVVAGPKEACEGAAGLFEGIQMKATVRPASKKDLEKPGEYDGSEVESLDAARLAQLQKEGTPLLVTFYAPWCGHCVQMVPEFKKTAAALRKSKVIVAAVNCENEKELCAGLGIRGYPSVKYLHGSTQADYKGPRTAIELTTFAQTQLPLSLAKEAIGGAIASAKQGLSKLGLSKLVGRGKTSTVEGGVAIAA